MNQLSPRITLLEKPQVFMGYLYGFRQPMACVALQIIELDECALPALQCALNSYVPEYPGRKDAIQTPVELITCIGSLVCWLQKQAGLPIFELPRINPIAEKRAAFLMWLPSLYAECFHATMAWVLQFVNNALSVHTAKAAENLAKTLPHLLAQLASYAPRGSNSLRLLTAAHAEHIPWMPLLRNIVQLGYGQQSRWLDSSFTDKSPQIAAAIARNKLCTAALLRKAGLPTPAQCVVNNEREAIELAHQLGYPVVVKPADGDGGLGVTAHIGSEKVLKQAYQHARQYSAQVILEKHIAGKDYRLLVLQGKLIWAVERIPATVFGDGISCIETLITQFNQQPGRAVDKHATLKPIEFSAQLTDLLAEQGFQLTDVPQVGQVIALSRIANISAGGTPRGVFDKIHPDNQRLMEAAAAILRLDLVGIDFISPDIQLSYRDNGGKIIEMNGQPQLGSITAAHIYQQIIATLMPLKGRIPIIVVYGQHPGLTKLIDALQAQLSVDYEAIGLVKNNTAYMNGEAITVAPSTYQAGVGLLLNQSIQALIYCIHDPVELAEHGLPFDQYDDLWVLSHPMYSKPKAYSPYVELEAGLFASCTSRMIVLEGAHPLVHTKQALVSCPILFVYLANLAQPAPLQTISATAQSSAYLNEQQQLVIESALAWEKAYQSLLLIILKN